ncbi:type II secretion system protein N [Ramlibacter sp. MAHUQ-53]|uniref:type II secretion system protein N n=1 Tax=unclassified Ramlibacter TaxID=2617605 RepID=UPI00362EFFDE
MARALPLLPAPRRAPWGWAVSGALAGLAAALVLFAPARWLAQAVAGASDGRVVLEDARGTLWDGSARLVLTGGPGSRDAAALPSRLAWRMRPALTGLGLALSADCCTPQPLQVRLQARGDGAQLTVLDAAPTQWPAALLAGLGTPWNTLQLEGDLQLATRGLALRWTRRGLEVSGGAEVSALRIASRLSTLRPMGSYRLSLAGGDTPALRLDTLEGSLLLSGQGHWAGARLRFSGEAAAAPEREAALSNLLNIIGQRQGARSLITIG